MIRMDKIIRFNCQNLNNCWRIYRDERKVTMNRSAALSNVNKTTTSDSQKNKNYSKVCQVARFDLRFFVQSKSKLLKSHLRWLVLSCFATTVAISECIRRSLNLRVRCTSFCFANEFLQGARMFVNGLSDRHVPFTRSEQCLAK